MRVCLLTRVGISVPSFSDFPKTNEQFSVLVSISDVGSTYDTLPARIGHPSLGIHNFYSMPTRPPPPVSLIGMECVPTLATQPPTFPEIKLIQHGP